MARNNNGRELVGLYMAKTTLIWDYSPSDYFESEFRVSDSMCSAIVESGKITFELITPVDPIPNALFREVKCKAEAILKMRMLQTHKSHELGNVQIQQEMDDGSLKTDHRIQGKAAIFKLTGYAPDILIKDPEGKIIKDTRTERIEAEKELLRATLQTNQTGLLNKLLESYSNAVSDAKNELIHLYEILDALSSKYGSRQVAQSELGIDRTNWDRLHDLANNLPLKQGRHRGSQRELRDATESELEEARQIGKELIERFIIKTAN
jgi:hypothetical protein